MGVVGAEIELAAVFAVVSALAAVARIDLFEPVPVVTSGVLGNSLTNWAAVSAADTALFEIVAVAVAEFPPEVKRFVAEDLLAKASASVLVATEEAVTAAFFAAAGTTSSADAVVLVARVPEVSGEAFALIYLVYGEADPVVYYPYY